jgi:hypothetical protein
MKSADRTARCGRGVLVQPSTCVTRRIWHLDAVDVAVREPSTPTRSESAQNWTRDHPRPSLDIAHTLAPRRATRSG